jgi:hypothetical protein
LPDRKRRWGVDTVAEQEVASSRVSTGCTFAARCPMVMAMCWTNTPPLYVPDPNRASACFLYRDSPVLESTDVATVFTEGMTASRP